MKSLFYDLTRRWPVYIAISFFVLIACAVVILLVASGSTFAAEALVSAAPVVSTTPVDVGPWGAFIASIQPTVSLLVTAVFTALGAVVAYYAAKILPSWLTSIVTSYYGQAAEAAAGWLNNYLANLAGKGATAPKTLTAQSPEVQEAVNYLMTSYPKAAAVAVNRDELAHDILAALGRLFPRLSPFIQIGEAVVDGMKK